VPPLVPSPRPHPGFGSAPVRRFRDPIRVLVPLPYRRSVPPSGFWFRFVTPSGFWFRSPSRSVRSLRRLTPFRPMVTSTVQEGTTNGIPCCVSEVHPPLTSHFDLRVISPSHHPVPPFVHTSPNHAATLKQVHTPTNCINRNVLLMVRDTSSVGTSSVMDEGWQRRSA